MGKPPKARSPIPAINLEAGMPLVHEALARLERELALARRDGHTVIKLIHGYGSSGAGGDIRIAVQKRLWELREHGSIRACIFGEEWSASDETTWSLLKLHPALKLDRDLGKHNAGITIAVL
jgi:hypothetical protein